MIDIFYFDTYGNQLGRGQSNDVVAMSTREKPPHQLSKWNGELWVTPSKVYTFDATTKEFISESYADLDPIEFKDLVPANATLIPPPEFDLETNIPIFIGDGWDVKDIFMRNLLALKEAKRDMLKQARDAIIFSPFNNVDVESSRSRDDVEGAIEYFDALSQGAGSIEWVMADNTFASLTKENLMAVKDGFVFRKAATFNQYKVALTQLASATTLEEIDGVTL